MNIVSGTILIGDTDTAYESVSGSALETDHSLGDTDGTVGVGVCDLGTTSRDLIAGSLNQHVPRIAVLLSAGSLACTDAVAVRERGTWQADLVVPEVAIGA